MSFKRVPNNPDTHQDLIENSRLYGIVYDIDHTDSYWNKYSDSYREQSSVMAVLSDLTTRWANVLTIQ